MHPVHGLKRPIYSHSFYQLGDGGHCDSRSAGSDYLQCRNLVERRHRLCWRRPCTQSSCLAICELHVLPATHCCHRSAQPQLSHRLLIIYSQLCLVIRVIWLRRNVIIPVIDRQSPLAYRRNRHLTSARSHLMGRQGVIPIQLHIKEAQCTV